MRLSFLLLLLISCYGANACIFDLYISIPKVIPKSYEFILKPHQIINDSFSIQIDSGIRITGKVVSCDGVINFELIDSTNRCKITGAFTKGLDTLNDQYYFVNPETGILGVKLERFFRPLPSGEWLLSDFSNVFIKRALYNNGIPVD
jgi:hypothetical protein